MRVVQRNGGDVQRRFALRRALPVHGLQRPVNNGQGAQAQEIELDQSGGFHIILVELGDQTRIAFFTVQRRKIGQAGRRDYHSARVLADVARQSLQLAGQINQRPDFLVVFIQPAQFRFLLNRFVEGDAQLERNQLGDTIHEPVGMTQHPPHVAHHRLGRHAAMSRNLRHPLPAVALGDVFDDPVPAFHAEINIEIRHRDPFGIQEPLEQQVIRQRVQIGDAEGVGDQRAGAGAAPRPDRHPMRPRPLDEIGDDQEIAGKAHLDDDFQLQLQPGVIGLAARGEIRGRGIQQSRQPLLQPSPGLGGEIVCGSHARRNWKIGQHVLAQFQAQVASPGNFNAVFQRLGPISKQFGHLCRSSQILLVAVAAGPARVVQGRAIVNAHPCFVGLEILALEKTDLIGSDHRRPGDRRQIHDRFQIRLFLGSAGALHFQIEPIREQFAPVRQPGLGLVQPVIQQRPPQFALAAPGQGNQSFRAAAQPGIVEHRHAPLLAFLIAATDQPGQVAIAGQVLTQKHQPGRFTLALYPNLDPGDRFDPGPQRGLVEFDQSKQVAHVGHCDRRHSGSSDLLDQAFDADQPIHQRIFGMQAQVNEIRRHDSFLKIS